MIKKIVQICLAGDTSKRIMINFQFVCDIIVKYGAF